MFTFYVKGKPIRALFDTGAQRTVISHTLYKEIQHVAPLIKAEGVEVYTATGDPIPVVGRAMIPVNIGSLSCVADALVCNNLHRELILGLEVQQEYSLGTMWNKKGKFCIHRYGEPLLMATTTFHDRVNVVTTDERVEIPARGVSVVRIQCHNLRRHRGSEACYHFDPDPELAEIHPNCVIQDTLHRNIHSTGFLQLTIVNLGWEAIIFSPGTTIG